MQVQVHVIHRDETVLVSLQLISDPADILKEPRNAFSVVSTEEIT